MNPLIGSEDQLLPLFQKRPTNYQPNVFTESRQEFTELEKKIVTLVVNQIGHMSLKGGYQPGSNLVFNVPFSELTKNNHKQIADAAESLQSKRLGYRNDVKKEFHYITPFPSVRSAMVDGKRVIELIMFSAVVPHFAELGQRYTKYDIDVMLSMSSVYSQRMFEIVSMYQNRGQHQFSYRLDRLMEILNCPPQYIFNDFRRNTLLIAQRELREKASIHLDWTVQKEGKKVVALEFSTKTVQQLAAEAVKQDQRTVNNMSINEAYTTAWQLMKNYKLKGFQKDRILSDHSLLDTFFRVDSELANGVRQNVKNPTAYLVKSLGIDQLKDPKPKSKPEPKMAQPTLSLFPQGPALRTGSAKSIAAIFGDMIMNE